MNFFYRQRRNALNVFDFYTGWNQLSYGTVTMDNPHWGVPGELGIELNPRGELLYLRAVPPLYAGPRLAQREPEWTNWFTDKALGFDLARLEKTTDKMLRPPDAYDQMQVWRGISPQTNEFYVEAAAYSGRPVYFEVVEPSRFAPTVAIGRLDPEAMMGWMYLAVVAGAVLLAWRNVRLRRSDRRGCLAGSRRRIQRRQEAGRSRQAVRAGAGHGRKGMAAPHAGH